jgi:hypothetical protein
VKRFCMLLIFIVFSLFPLSASAENIDPDNNGSQYAWGENVGWLNLEPGGDGGNGVDVTSTDLTGYIWGENIGWINLSPTNYGGVVNDGVGNLSGYAWGENVGWINFSGVAIHPVTGLFSGYAWGENIGWINFAPPGIGIKTSWINPQACTDNDHDGYSIEGGSCGSVDCDDNDPLEHPNQVWYVDVDNDGYSNGNMSVQCVRPVSYKAASELTATSGDCDDQNIAINPGATEICDNVDNNCDGQIDEGLTTTYYQDADTDSYGNPANSIQACVLPSGYVTDNTDCDDNDAKEHPSQTWYKDEDNDGYSDGTKNTTSCTRPTYYKVLSELTDISGDCNDKNPTINPDTGICDSIDPDNSGLQYAWGENVGWINFEPSQGPGITVTNSAVTGYAWGENIGWISLSCDNTGVCSLVNYGVINDGSGNLSGYAWGENVGWINFSPTGGGVNIDACGDFNGMAWGENIGWISFRSDGPNPFKVRTSWASPIDNILPVTVCAPQLQTWYNADAVLTLSAADCGTGVREVHHRINSEPEIVTPGESAIATVSPEGCNTLGYFSVDNANNAEAGKQVNVCVDKTPPYITIIVPPEGAAYYLNTAVTADYSVTDSLSGVLTSSADIMDTSALGSHTFTVSATDSAGNINSVTHTYTIAYPGNIDPDSTGCQYAWGENVGWINFNPSWGPGITVTDTAVTGYAWGENIGWINLSPSNGGVVNDGSGNLSGYAWGENIGWINFGPLGGVRIGSDGKFTGYAWGENIGWINFSSQHSCVKTSWRGVPAPDVDGDGYNSVIDCDDNNPNVHPGADDTNCNGIDENCDGVADNNYVPTATTCGQGVCASAGQLLCQNAQIINTCVPTQSQTEGPYGAPTCSDGKDNDCDSTTDANDSDCIQECIPTTEVCDGVDNDCDGFVDENLGTTTCGVGACQITVDNCANGVVQTCTPGSPSPEVCNNLDDDCDSVIDEDLGTTTCGVGACQVTVANCVGGAPQVCTPGSPQPEVCDNIDNNCDGVVDEDLNQQCGCYRCMRVWHADL